MLSTRLGCVSADPAQADRQLRSADSARRFSGLPARDVTVLKQEHSCRSLLIGSVKPKADACRNVPAGNAR